MALLLLPYIWNGYDTLFYLKKKKSSLSASRSKASVNNHQLECSVIGLYDMLLPQVIVRVNSVPSPHSFLPHLPFPRETAYLPWRHAHTQHWLFISVDLASQKQAEASFSPITSCKHFVRLSAPTLRWHLEYFPDLSCGWIWACHSQNFNFHPVESFIHVSLPTQFPLVILDTVRKRWRTTSCLFILLISPSSSTLWQWF